MTDGNLNRINKEHEYDLENTVTETVVEHNEDNVSDRERQNESNNSGREMQGENNVPDREKQNEIIINSAETSAAVLEEVKSETREARIECHVCKVAITNNLTSIQPCPCEYWVHYHCLVSGIQSYEANHPDCAQLGCRICMTPYNISPQKNWIVIVVDKVSIRYRQFCEFGFGTLTVVLVDSAFTAFGLATLHKIYGLTGVEEQLSSINPIKVVAICKAIPLFSIGVNFIPWETKLLRFLRRCSQLPVIGRLFPSMDARVREEKHRRTLFGTLVGGLLLPWHAYVLGGKLFGTVQSRLGRFLLGGVTFLALKGAFQMYYRQRLYVRQCFLSVLNYDGA